MSEYGCDNNDKNGEENNLVSLQDLSEQVEKIVQTILPFIQGIDDINDISSVVLVSRNNKVTVLQSSERPTQQPVQLFMTQRAAAVITYGVGREGELCCAYKVTHSVTSSSDGKQSVQRSIQDLRCDDQPPEDINGIRYTIKKKDGKCCIVWQKITFGQMGDPDGIDPENGFFCA